MMVLFTFTEIVPVGILVSLITALFVKRKTNQAVQVAKVLIN